ncbi:hypothetical protein APSETT445_000296 [Aspergillus pseudonomiae]
MGEYRKQETHRIVHPHPLRLQHLNNPPFLLPPRIIPWPQLALLHPARILLHLPLLPPFHPPLLQPRKPSTLPLILLLLPPDPQRRLRSPQPRNPLPNLPRQLRINPEKPTRPRARNPPQHTRILDQILLNTGTSLRTHSPQPRSRLLRVLGRTNTQSGKQMRAHLGDLRRADHPLLVIGVAGLDAGRDVGVVLEHSEEGCFGEREGRQCGLRGGVEVGHFARGGGHGARDVGEDRGCGEEGVDCAGLQQVLCGGCDGCGARFGGRGGRGIQGAGDGAVG